MSTVLEKKIESVQDIEIGDIYYASWGYDQTNIDFYKVIKKTKAMIWLRAIGQKYVKQTSWASEDVLPDPENELFETDWVLPENIKAGWEKVEVEWHEQPRAQEAGYIKVKTPKITKHVPQFYKYGVYVRMGHHHASPFDGKPKHQSHWA